MSTKRIYLFISSPALLLSFESTAQWLSGSHYLLHVGGTFSSGSYFSMCNGKVGCTIAQFVKSLSYFSHTKFFQRLSWYFDSPLLDTIFLNCITTVEPCMMIIGWFSSHLSNWPHPCNYSTSNQPLGLIILPNIKVKGSAVRVHTDRQMDRSYQVHYLPASLKLCDQ